MLERVNYLLDRIPGWLWFAVAIILLFSTPSVGA